MATEYEETGWQGGLTPRRTKILMALVAVITGIAIWLVPVEEQQVPPSLPPLPSAPGSSEALPLPPRSDISREAVTALAPPNGIVGVINGGDRARAFIAEARAEGSPPDASVVFAEAERMQGEGRLEDAYLLYRFAARHGHAQAALILGTQADPAYHAEAASYLPEPESAQAYKWYSMAATAGNEEAVQRLQDLYRRLQQDAGAGDDQARRLLLQWQ